MLPKRMQYGRGFQEFTWDGELTRALGLRLDDFGAVAEVGGYGYPVVAPLLLRKASFPARIPVQGCSFIYIPNETMTVDYHLRRKGGQAPVLLQNTAETWHENTKQSIVWNGQDRQGRPAPEGWYILA